MRKLYTPKEEKTLTKYGASESVPELMKRLKDKRSYKSIEKKLITLGVKRDPTTYKKSGRKPTGRVRTTSGEVLTEKIVEIAKSSLV